MAELGFAAFDADNHYYEAEDAFTRHIDPAMSRRTMQWATIDGKKKFLVGGKINRFIPNPTFNPIARPGSLEDYFRNRNTEGLDLVTMFGELEQLDDNPGYRDRDARIELLDRQGLTGALLYPTIGVGMQEALKRDPEALHAAFEAFNRWLEDDWGYDYKGRLFAAPMITFADPARAAAEVDRVLAAGARILCMVPGPVPTGTGYQSPGMRDYDPIWARISEAGVPMAIHAGLGGTGQYSKLWEPGRGQFEGFKHSVFPLVAFHGRDISDTMAAIICHGVFERFPGVRIASIENGAMWIPDLLRMLGEGYGKMPFAFADHPVDQFRHHVWVSPFYEDDMNLIKELVGIDRMIFGSDFPHAEGLPEPTDFVRDIPDFTDDEIHKIMLDNVQDLLVARPVL